MSRVLTEKEIAELLAEAKPLPANWRSRLSVRQKADRSFTHREFDVQGSRERKFRIIIRGNSLNPSDFSLILVFRDTDGSDYRLVRFNGRHPSQHTNKWEKTRNLTNSTFRNRFHIHMATERYQLDGYEIDGYAEVTDRYDSQESAIQLFVRSNGLEVAEDEREDEGSTLFEQREEDQT